LNGFVQFWSTKWAKHTGGIGIGKAKMANRKICALEWLLPFYHKIVKFT